ncbi:aluminum-activated malate transporter 2-like isoform X2 [Momordica charantia]|uniref:Aluminum-activated malate transporter 2-like isoform X2 n=1 Tax=Momordica charantia TaxID=3673 RepID=A0A6J1CKA6_MOMCH|nr:aluminum-activated malate transporter 2-like isoform X2 [Momordica charantia]
MEIGCDEKVGLLGKGWIWVKGLVGKLVGVARKAKALGKDDPRRVIHSLKLGLALTIVSLLYYYKPLYANFGVSAMWAVITVVVVFEFSVACILTFVRFFPNIKAKHDYGMVIGILTFSLVSISELQDDQIFELLQKRVSTIFIGVSVCVVISILISPVWAGQDLHNRIALNIENLAIFLEGFGAEYFKTLQDREAKDEKFTQAYKSILKSSGIEETLYNFARWEPGHGCFQFRHPWKQYLKIGTLTHECAYRIDALHRNLSASNIQVSQEIIRTEITEPCIEMSIESGKALRQLVSSIREMTRPTKSEIHIHNSKAAAKKLRTSLRSSRLWEDCDLLTLIPAATTGSLLVDVVECSEKIAEAVQELASLAHFKTVVSLEKSEASAHIIEVEKGQPKNGISFVTIPISGG